MSRRIAALCLVFLAGCDPVPEKDASLEQATGQAIWQAKCASCHEAGGKAPGLAALGLKDIASVLFAQTNGVMKHVAKDLDLGQKIAVAEFVTGGRQAYQVPDDQFCDSRKITLSPAYAGHWGLHPSKTAAVGPAKSVIRSDNVNGLKLKWAFGLPSVSDMRSQPVVAGNVLIIATTAADLFALDRQVGCIKWHRNLPAGVRTAITLNNGQLLFGDVDAHLNALDALTGEQVWRRDMAISEYSMLTGAVMAGRDGLGAFLIVPVSTYEVGAAADDNHECCRSHGAVHRLDAQSGDIIWTAHMTEEAKPRGTSKRGVQQWGPAGASVWSTPTIDMARGLVYVGTGQNTALPATDKSDAIVALDLLTGAVRWHFQATAGDSYNSACSSYPKGSNCPKWEGPDFDFGAQVILAKTADGKDVLLAGQKSGDIYALDPDDQGRVIWRTRIGAGSALGGVHWGMALSDGLLFAAANDPLYPIPKYHPRPGVSAIDIETGETVWSFDINRDCETDLATYFGRSDLYPDCVYHHGPSAALMLSNDVLFVPALDGKLRALDRRNGMLLWQYNTMRPFETVNRVKAHGGAMDNVPVLVAGPMLYAQSGYSLFGQLPGNVLLAFELAVPESD